MPNPRVNHTREGPRLQPTMSLALLVQVGGMPGWPTAWPSGSSLRSIALGPFVKRAGAGGKGICVFRVTHRLQRRNSSPRERPNIGGFATIHAHELRPRSWACEEAFHVMLGPSSTEVTG